MKKCAKCGKDKLPKEFCRCKNMKDGLYSYCRECVSLRMKSYYRDNPNKFKEKREHNYRLYKEKWKKTRKRYYVANKTRLLKLQKDRLKDPKIRKRRNKVNARRDRYRRKTDINYRLKRTLRTRIWHALKGLSKTFSTTTLIGCSIDHLKNHIQSKWKPLMTWDNYGQWHVDHIIPCSSFDLSTSENQKKCFHYTNLQPLWAIDNITKNNNVA